MLVPNPTPAIGTRFTLGPRITPEQRAHLDAYGFLVFARVAAKHEVDTILSELDRINADWLASGRKEVNGIPLFTGRGPEGQPLIQRSPFTSTFSDYIRDFVRDGRFDPVRSLVGDETRVGLAQVLEAGAPEDQRARELLLAKYAATEDDLDEWGRTSLPVVVEFPSDAV